MIFFYDTLRQISMYFVQNFNLEYLHIYMQTHIMGMFNYKHIHDLFIQLQRAVSILIQQESKLIFVQLQGRDKLIFVQQMLLIKFFE